jgi:hypothetical protein
MIRKTASLLLLIAIVIFSACSGGPKDPDVSGVHVQLTTVRFEKELFAIDSTSIDQGMQRLSAKYPGFTRDFLVNILGIPQESLPEDRTRAVGKFISDYAFVKKETEQAIPDLAPIEKDVKLGLQHVKYYFPDYKLPAQFITFIGPMDAFAQGATGGGGDIITPDALGVGLQLHLGRNSSLYTSELGQQLYPSYVSRRFEPNTITVNAMRNIVDDIVPQSNDQSLLGVMVDKGKRMYLLDLFLPHTADSLKFGYTSEQMKGAKENEGLIWNFFLENNLVYETDAQKIKSYVGDGPKTVELGDGSPGYIALFTGRQIVNAYMDKFPKTSLKDLLAMDAKKILTESAYKPR